MTRSYYSVHQVLTFQVKNKSKR